MASDSMSPISVDQIRSGISALKQYKKLTQKKTLLDNDEIIFALFNVKRTWLAIKKYFSFPLPHPYLLFLPKICLFVKDLEWKTAIEETKEYYKKLLAQKGVDIISEIITVKELKTRYREYILLRNLANAHDLFLTDEKIWPQLTRILGKEFYIKRKFPIKINLSVDELKDHVTQVLSYCYFQFNGNGKCNSLQIGFDNSPDNELAENIVAAVKFLSENIPGGWKNIRSLYITTNNATTIPLYMSDGSANKVIMPRYLPQKDYDTVEEEELSTFLNVKVKVHPGGRIDIISEKTNEQINIAKISDLENSE